MAKKLLAILGGVMTVIGYGGTRGDLQGWGEILNVGNFSSDIWWTILLVFGLCLLAANLIPTNQWQRLFRRLPPIIYQWVKSWGIGTDGITGFYTNRKSMSEKYGGIDWELDNSKVIWACWPAATIAAHKPKEQLGKVKRLLLSHPNNSEIKKYAEIRGWHVLNEAQASIKFATRAFKAEGTEVRWYDAPVLSITIGDPDSKHAWARVEVLLYGEGAIWQNYLIHRLKNIKAYEAIKKSFEDMWDSKWSKQPVLDE